jgi:aryl-alcohol dehydrogenase-like predicted oxidoreductase
VIEGHATLDGTKRFATRSETAKGHFRHVTAKVFLSSVGLGTYLGAEDSDTDRGYEECASIALGSGVNVFDTAINYRGQRSERALCRALTRAIEEGSVARDEVFLSSKGGYLPHDAEDPRPPRTYILETFVEPGIAPREEIVAGGHCISPGYLRDQIERSRRNLGVETIDLYYLHNVEAQRTAVDEATFRKRILGAVEVLEAAVDAGEIGVWGLATWDGLRVPQEHPEHVSMAKILEAARDVAGEKHHFCAVQLPVNLAMPQAISYPSQMIGQGKVPVLRAAQALGLSVFGSATLLQGRLAADLPEEVVEAFPEATTAARRAIQFARSPAGMTASLVGTSTAEHARDDFGLSGVSPADPARVMALFS